MAKGAFNDCVILCKSKKQYTLILEELARQREARKLSDEEILDKLGQKYLDWCHSCPEAEATLCIRDEWSIRFCFKHHSNKEGEGD